MKLIGIVFIFLATMVHFEANATAFGRMPSTNAYAGAEAFAGGGNANGTLRGGDQRSMMLMLPGAASAIAPGVASQIICPMVIPKSKAKQNILWGSSEADGYVSVPICVGHHLKDEQMVRAIMCQDEQWKAADAALGRNSCQ